MFVWPFVKKRWKKVLFWKHFSKIYKTVDEVQVIFFIVINVEQKYIWKLKENEKKEKLLVVNLILN